MSELKSSDFVYLHNHTEMGSLLDGLSKIDEMVEKVKEYGMVACGITDHGRMAGALDFYKKCKQNGINPVIGCEFYVAKRKHTDKEPEDKPRSHLTVLCISNQGWKNLCELNYRAGKDGFYYKPRIDKELLLKCKEGLVVLSGCASGEIGEALKIDDYNTAREIALWYKENFGENFYLEIQMHGHKDFHKHWDVQGKINDGLDRLSKELDIPQVLTADSHYVNKDDTYNHEILLCIGTASNYDNPNRMSLQNFDLSLTDPQVVIDLFGKTHPEAIRNTKRIADQNTLEIEMDKTYVPTFLCPDGLSEKDYLRRLTWKGLTKRYLNTEVETEEEAKKILSKEIIDQTEYELSTVNKLGYNGYFLITQEFIVWGKDRGILFGPGRGSAAGSIVCYALRITEIDPIEADLMFERFLNPDRLSMPDIDTDIQDSRRDEVLDHCKDLYGNENVTCIGVFGTLRAKNAVRDVARVLEYPYTESLKLSKMISDAQHNGGNYLPNEIKENEDFKKEYEGSSEVRKIVDTAIKLEGNHRTHGVHACAVVISPKPIYEYMPCEAAQNGEMATQFAMHDVEELGLLKMDFLGLSTLTVIDNTVKMIKKTRGVDVDIHNIPLDDYETYKLYREKRSNNTFTFNSPGMRATLAGLEADNFEDLVATNALYRPGPMQYIGSYIKRKKGTEKIKYLLKGSEKFLSKTYGYIVYQEQWMRICEFYGFRGGELDNARKAIAKKNVALMEVVKEKFYAGAMEHGNSKQTIDTFWNELLDFANYSFNRSHAYAYALVGYQTAYLKAHYPAEYMASIMINVKGDKEKLETAISDARSEGVKVNPPNVVESDIDFTVNSKGEIVFGLSAIKGIGKSADIIVEKANGKDIKTLEEFLSLFPGSELNKRSLEGLAKSGALDNFGDRYALVFSLGEISEQRALINKEFNKVNKDQTSLLDGIEDFTVTKLNIIRPPKIDRAKMFQDEREYIGTYVSGHPLDDYESKVKNKPGTNIWTGVIGLISSKRIITTRYGDKMCFLVIDSKKEEFEVTVPPKVYKIKSHELKENHPLLMSLERKETESGQVKWSMVDSRDLLATDALLNK